MLLKIPLKKKKKTFALLCQNKQQSTWFVSEKWGGRKGENGKSKVESLFMV